MKRTLLRTAVAAALVAVLPAAAAKAAPTVACSGDPSVATRIDLTVAGTPAFGLYAVPAGPPNGLIVVDHGYGHTVESWRSHLSDMARRDGVIAVAMDYRNQVDNFSATPRPTSRGWRVQEGAEDSVAVAQLFDSQCRGLPTIDVYSVSMGGNTAGLALALKAKRANGQPLFDYWFDIEGAVNVSETYTGARLLAPVNAFAKNAQEDIETEMGGTFEQKPDVYANRTVVNRIDDIKASGLRGVVLVHGVGDGLVPYNQAQEMVARLRQVGIPSDLFSVGTRGPNSEAGTTLDGYVIGGVSPFAGHASEASDTHLVGTTGFDRLAAFFNRGEAPCDRAFAVDGNLGTVAPDPATTPPLCTVHFAAAGTTGSGSHSQGGASLTGGGQVALSPRTACPTRKRFKLAVTPPRRKRLVDVTVFVNGRAVARKRGGNVRSVVLHKLPAGSFKIKVVATTKDHRLLTASRRFLACGSQGQLRPRSRRTA